jgi:Tfp pilus assembly protein PilZ
MSIKLILVCREGEARQAYLKEAKASGLEVDIDVVSTYGELSKAMTGTPYQGIMVDLVTSMKASKEERGVAQDILEVFPIVQLRWESEGNAIRTFSTGNKSSSSSLIEFITNECESFAARAVRLYGRKAINFNVKMSKNEVLYEKFLEYTVTINASKGGFFLFSARQWKPGENVWLIVNELEDKTPIVGNVRWNVIWGKRMTMPGIGITFKQINPGQSEELINKFSI